MNINQATIELRPRSVPEIIDLSLLFYRTHIAIFTKIALTHGLFVVGLSMLVHWATDLWFLGLLAFWYLSVSLSGSTVAAAGQKVFGMPVSLKSALSSSIRYGWVSYITSVLHRTVWLTFSVFFIGLMWRNRWGFTMCLAVLERLGGNDLSKRRTGLTVRAGTAKYNLDMASVAIASAYLLGLMMICELALNDFITLWPESGLFHLDVLSDPIRVGIWLLGLTFVRPIVDLSWLFLYIDTRTRGEGWDLELKFKSFAADRATRSDRTLG